MFAGPIDERHLLGLLCHIPFPNDATHAGGRHSHQNGEGDGPDQEHGAAVAAVLILGETGSGKERVAHALHESSGRTGAFVPMNCATLSPTLAESELFGHVKGAFTGANQPSEGLFVAANGGTLFLDEIGELPLDLQAKLLRALEMQEVRPVGAAASRKVDVRVLAATHRPLQERADAGTFRGDLYARLAGWTLKVPALRERKDDVLALSRHFLARFAENGVGSQRLEPYRLSIGAAESLLCHGWPYNVRELAQVLTAAAIRAGHACVIRREHLSLEPSRKRAAPSGALSAPRPSEEPSNVRTGIPSEEVLKRTLLQFSGNVAQVADFFSKDRRQVYRWLDQLGINVRDYRGPAPEGQASDD